MAHCHPPLAPSRCRRHRCGSPGRGLGHLGAQLQFEQDAAAAPPAPWLVPTFKTATAETAARHLVTSVLPDVLVSDRDTRFTSAFWTGLHLAMGASLIFNSPHHHNTNSK